MRKRRYATQDESSDFYRAALADRLREAKLPLGRLESAQAISTALGKAVAVDEIVAQASYLHHIHDNHGPGGLRKDALPVTAADLAHAVAVINADMAPVNTGRTSHVGNPLLTFEQQIGGVTYKVIGEIREGKRNRNVAVFNLFKRR